MTQDVFERVKRMVGDSGQGDPRQAGPEKQRPGSLSVVTPATFSIFWICQRSSAWACRTGLGGWPRRVRLGR
jgi:hypothetical protein